MKTFYFVSWNVKGKLSKSYKIEAEGIDEAHVALREAAQVPAGAASWNLPYLIATVDHSAPVHTYKLVKSQASPKAKKLYQVICNETGEVVSSRQSDRDYVAASIFGDWYFGRVDLVGKGDHGKSMSLVSFAGAPTPVRLQVAYLESI